MCWRSGAEMRHQMYDLALDPETPVFLAPGRLRKEVGERIGPSGEVIGCSMRRVWRGPPMSWRRPGARP